MNFPPIFHTLFFLALTSVFTGLHAQEPKGRWTPPPLNGSPWKHGPTEVSFPAMLGGYRFAGHFDYADGGVLLRYENLQEQARMDLFLFKTNEALPTVDDKHRRLLMEMDIVIQDFESMVQQRRYKNLVIGEVFGGELALWQKQSVPIASRTFTATRLGISNEGSAEAAVRQWVGVTILDDYLITIRHMRPAATGDAGEESMKRIVGLVFQLLKDPALRSHIRELVDAYLKDPFSEHGVQASGAVLAYLKQTPYFPISIPEVPVSDWLAHCKAIAPGTEEDLLRAFMLGSAKAAFASGDADTCLKEGSRQFAKVYRILVAKHPGISRPEMESFATAAENGEGHLWLKDYELRK
ncbi:hypothetical protein [Prosthecobacter fusiformis]|nr:hypothetical protein [Prosthecobacter fusiformis]